MNLHRLVWLLALLGCDDAGGRAGDSAIILSDARPPDAGSDAVTRDARPLDARPPVDATVRDASPVDARPPDAVVRDAGPGDAARPDARVIHDASPPDASPPDAVVDAFVDASLPACEGIVLPPPPDSPDGSEVCNYRDDDGDGLVDEGFAYDFLGEPVRITQEPQRLIEDQRIVWSGDGYGVVWYGPGGFRFVKLGADGCPTSRIWTVDQNPLDVHVPQSMDLAFSGSRFAAMFTERRPGEGTGIGTFVQLFDLSGRPVGRLIDLDRRLSFFGKNAIVPFGDNFAVFASAFSPGGGLNDSYFAILDQEGRVVLGPSHPYDPEPGQGQAMSDFIGMAFDGEGFGMAWVGDGTWFMRWSPEGNVLVPPLRYGALGAPSEIGWDGRHFLLPDEIGRTFRIHYLAPDGEVARWSPVELGDDRFNAAGTLQIVGSEGMAVILGWSNGPTLYRLGPDGSVIESRPFAGEDYPDVISALLAGGGYAVLSSTSADGGQTRSIDFRRFGCR